MIYNGFRRIALAHSLLPAPPLTEACEQPEESDERRSGLAPASPPETLPASALLEST